MSTDLGISLSDPAPLPWYPPFCKAYEGKIAKYDKMPSLGQWQMIGVTNAEKDIEEEYTKHSPEKNLQEWGARVSMALKRVSNFL